MISCAERTTMRRPEDPGKKLKDFLREGNLSKVMEITGGSIIPKKPEDGSTNESPNTPPPDRRKMN